TRVECRECRAVFANRTGRGNVWPRLSTTFASARPSPLLSTLHPLRSAIAARSLHDVIPRSTDDEPRPTAPPLSTLHLCAPRYAWRRCGAILALRYLRSTDHDPRPTANAPPPRPP